MTVRKIVVCPDSFKGTMTAREAATAIEEGIRDVYPEITIESLPIGDGGEGTAEALREAFGHVETITAETLDPLGRPMRASYFIAEGETAVIETAAASGLTLLAPEERDIMRADTFGTGLLIADAWKRGIRKFIVGMGGSATCDGGYGALRAMREVIEPYKEHPELEITLLCDVDNPLCGPVGAAAVFGPQKGADAQTIPLLEAQLIRRAEEYSEGGIDVRDMPCAGAAGGLAGMLMACYGARARMGIEEVLRRLDFGNHLKGADLVITGEGRGDLTTLRGKAPKGVLDAARPYGVPVALVCGRIADREALLAAGFCAAAEAPWSPDSSTPPSAILRQAARDLICKLK